MQLRFVVVRFGQSQQDHGQLLPGDFSLCIVAHTLKNGLLELVQVLRVVILQIETKDKPITEMPKEASQSASERIYLPS